MSASVFHRYEYKYLLDEKQARRLLELAGDRLTADIHGLSTIQSLYFDTPDHLLIRRSLEKPLFKEKMRLRSYGLAGPDDPIFWEIKRKCQGLVYKRRIQTTSRALRAGAGFDSQIGRELSAFLEQYPSLSPRMLLLYDRTAFFGAGDLRLTFDRSIRFRTDRLSLSAGLDGSPLLEEGAVLMEIKTAAAIPLWLGRALSQNQIFKTSFSKYGTAFTQGPVSSKEVMKVG